MRSDSFGCSTEMNFTLDTMNPVASGGSVASWNIFPHDLKVGNNTACILFLFITVNIHELAVSFSKLHEV